MFNYFTPLLYLVPVVKFCCNMKLLHFQAQPFSKEELAHPVADSFSSLIYSFRPTISSGFDGYKSNRLNSRHDISPSSSLLSSGWKSISSRWKDKSLGSNVEFGLENGGYESLEICEEDDDHVSLMDISCSDKIEETSKVEEASTLRDAAKSLPDLMDESAFISSNLFEFLHSSLPNIVKGCQWVLLYR